MLKFFFSFYFNNTLYYENGVIYSVEKQARKAFADAKFFFFELFSLKFAYFQPFFSVRGETSNFFFFVCFFSCAAWFTSYYTN